MKSLSITEISILPSLSEDINTGFTLATMFAQ